MAFPSCFFGALGVGVGRESRVGVVVGEAAMEALQESQMCSCPPHIETQKASSDVTSFPEL